MSQKNQDFNTLKFKLVPTFQNFVRLYFDTNYQDGFRRDRKINREKGEIISGVDEL